MVSSSVFQVSPAGSTDPLPFDLQAQSGIGRPAPSFAPARPSGKRSVRLGASDGGDSLTEGASSEAELLGLT